MTKDQVKARLERIRNKLASQSASRIKVVVQEDKDKFSKLQKSIDTLCQSIDEMGVAQLEVLKQNISDTRKTLLSLPSDSNPEIRKVKDVLMSMTRILSTKLDESSFKDAEIADKTLEAIKELKTTVSSFKPPKTPEEAWAVRLSDGDEFYKAVTEVINTGFATAGNVVNIPKVTLTGGQQALPVVNPDGSNIGGGSGTSAYSDSSNTDKKGLVDSDRHVQVDVLSTPTDVDIRDLTSVSDSVSAVQSGTWNITNVSGTVSLPTGAATSAKQDTIIGHVDGIESLLTTIDADTGNISTKIDTLAGAVSGTEMQVDVLTMPTVTVTATNLDVQSGGSDLATSTQAAAIQTAVETIDNAIAGSEMQVDIVAALPAGTNAIGKLAANDGVDIGDVTINNATIAVTQSGTWDEVGINDSGNSITVDNGGTFAVQVDGSALTALQLIDDVVYTDDTSTHSTGSSKGALFMAAATPTDGSVNANDIGAVAMTTDRKLHVSVQDALPAGTNAIGKLSANSGVDIGDVDVTSISAGSNLVGDVGIQPRTTNGLDTFMASGSDGSSILVATAQAVKASAGKVYGYYIYNPEAAVSFVHFYNTASGSVTVGTTNPLFTLPIPAGSAANLMSEIGITFGTAITVAATTTAGGNTAPATGVSATIWYK